MAIVLAPEARAQGVTSPYLQIVWRYRAGDVAGAVRAAAALPRAGLRDAVLRDLEPHVCEVLAGSRDCDGVKRRQPELYATRVVPLWRTAMPAAVLLHLHTSHALGRTTAVDDAVAHRRIAAVLVDRLARVEDDSPAAEAAKLRAIRRRAHVLLAWLLQQRLELDALDAQLRQSLRAFPDDPDLLLASGWIDEAKAGPAQLQGDYDGRPDPRPVLGGRSGWISRERAFRLARAEALYRRSLAAAPPSIAAQVRLGRVLALQNRLDDARGALAGAAGTSTLPRIRYLCALFTAGVEEQAGRPAAARAQYQAALRIWPAGQAARSGLSRLLARDGDRAGASALIAALPAEPPIFNLAGDPWWWYPLGESWGLADGLAALRAELIR